MEGDPWAQVEGPDEGVVGLAPRDGEGGDELPGVIADNQGFVDVVVEGVSGALVYGVGIEGQRIAGAEPDRRTGSIHRDVTAGEHRQQTDCSCPIDHLPIRIARFQAFRWRPSSLRRPGGP